MYICIYIYIYIYIYILILCIYIFNIYNIIYMYKCAVSLANHLRAVADAFCPLRTYQRY